MIVDKLKDALAEVAAERVRAMDRLDAIVKVKERYRWSAHDMAEEVRDRAESGDEGAEIAYMNLKRGEKLMS